MNRVAVFKSTKGFFMTPIISPSLPWPKVAHKFIQAKTLEEFEKVCTWAHGGAIQRMPRTYSASEIDEHLLVYEDWGTTGAAQTYVCSQCGYTELVRFFPDGRTSRFPNRCVQCGEEMGCCGDLLSREKWESAIELLHSKPGEYLIGDRPVKILKIVGFNGGDIQYQVLFRDWSTAIINKLSHSEENDIPNVRFF